MKHVSRKVIVVSYAELPHMEISSNDTGISVYKGVIVKWDEDHDTRILDFIDDLDEHFVRELFSVQEHEGSIAFQWREFVPTEFSSGYVDCRCGDCWSIYESTVVDAVQDKPVELAR